MRIKILNTILFVAMVAVNYLATSLPINGKTTGELSDLYVNLFVPAGITFAIWGLIYLLLFAFSIIQFRSSFRSNMSENYLFINSCVLNIYWIICWHYEQIFLSLLIMIGLLIILTIINVSLAEEKNEFLRLVFGVYLGWIFVATIANATALLVSVNWQRFGLDEVTWTIIMIASGIVVTAVNMIRLNNPYLAIAVIWAFNGIVLKRNSDQPDIVLAAQIAMGAVAFAAIWTLIRRKRVRVTA